MKSIEFSPANRKLRKLAKTVYGKRFLKNNRKIYSFDLLAGRSCPFANKCKSYVKKTNGSLKAKDGPNTEIRCYAASLEVLYPPVYNLHKRNLNKMRYHSRTKTRLELSYYIEQHIPRDAGIIRIHSSGDFFNQVYFDAWNLVAIRNPNILFYAYTKALEYWHRRIDQIPTNMVLTASYGGKLDDVIKPLGLRSAIIVHNRKEAKKLGLAIDENDSLAANPNHGNFALLIHGIQPAGTKAAKSVYKINRGIK